MRVRPLLSNFVVAGVAFGALSAGSTAALAACNGPLQLHCVRPNTVQAPADTAPVPSSGQQYGFNDNGLYNQKIPRNVFLDNLQNSGAHYLRHTMSWQDYEPRPGVYDATFFTHPDRDYNDLLARGIQEVIILIGTPSWAVTTFGRGARSADGHFRCDGSNSPCIAPPDINRAQVMTQWQHFVRVVTARYPKAAGIEVWNEPNIQAFWLQQQDPVLYAHILAATSQAAHSVNAKMPVLIGSMANYYGSTTTSTTRTDTFLRTIYRTVGATAFNAIGWHYYPCDDNATEQKARASRFLDGLRAVRDAFHDTSKPFWLTETGATTSGKERANCGQGAFTEQQQSNYIGTILNWTKSQNAQHHDVPIVLIHSLYNGQSRRVISQPNGAGNDEYGLIAYAYDDTTRRTTFQDKAAYQTARCKMHATC